tara:strand:- start:1163 stop:1528 length:366 start_codon:yes stop_codon:yes gene_type:complete
MGASREYAYYWEGQSLAIVELDDGEWKSPVENISESIDITYTYVPKAVDGSPISDESDEISNISNAIARALVYYLKARIAEDMSDFETKEYYMREFYKLIDKTESNKIGSVRIMQAPIAIR